MRAKVVDDPKFKNELRAMIIEDNPADVQMFKLMLERQNYKISLMSFTSGEAALDWLKEHANPTNLPHFIALDLNLPGEHGIEILQKIKLIPIASAIPVIIHTSSKDQEHIVQAYKLGGTFFMPKSYNAEMLNEVISHLFISGRIKAGA